MTGNIYYGIGSPHNTRTGVKKLQQDLILLGYGVGSAGADGLMGNGTKSAIVRFQKANKLTPDGLAGRTTLAKISELVTAKNKPKPEPAQNMYYHKTHNNKHPRVKKLQEDLNKLGYKLAVDVIFGQATENAIKDYQKKNGLKVNGIADTDTLRHIMYAVRRLDEEVAKPKPPKAPPKDDGGLYRVQTGAYGVKANAEAKLKELKDKGIDGYIKKD